MNRLRILWEKIRILVQILRINLRTSVIVLIGLSIALSTITASYIYLETTRADYYLSLLEPNQVFYSHRVGAIQSFNESEVLGLQEAFDARIREEGLEEVLIAHPLYPRCYITNRLSFLNQSEWYSAYGFNLNESILDDCVEGSSFPATMNQTLLLTSSVSGINIGDYFNVSFINYGNNMEYYKYPLQITGVLTPESLRTTSPLWNIFPHLQSSDPNRRRSIMLMDLGAFFDLYTLIESIILSITDEYNLEFELQLRFNHQISFIDSSNVLKLVPKLVSFLKESKEDFYLNNVEFRRRYGSSITEWIYKVEEYDLFFFYFFLMCIPIFLLSVLLIRFSLGVINVQRRKSLVLFRMRGVSISFLIGTLVVEALLISIFASILSIIFGILGYLVISTTTGYLTFNLHSFSPTFVFPHSLIIWIFFFGICLTIIPYLWPMTRLIRSKLFTLEEESSGIKKYQRRKILANLDFFLLAQGTLGILFLIFITQIFQGFNLSSEVNQVYTLFLPIIILLLILSPFSFILGFIFAYNRFIPILLIKIGNFFEKKDWGLFSTASRNLSINIKVTTRVTLLIACTLSFLMVLSSLPLSVYNYRTDSIYYWVGADIEIIIDRDLNATAVHELQLQLSSIEGLISTMISEAGFEAYDNTFYFLGIDEDFSNVAHWRNYYDDQSLQELVDSLFSSSNEYPIILDSLTAREKGLSKSNTYQPFIREPSAISFAVEGVSDNWPQFIYARYSTHHYLITKRNLIDNISISVQDYNDVHESYTYPDHILCKVLPGYDPVTISNQVLNVTDNTALGVSSANSTIDNETNRLSYQFAWAITNFNFLVSLLVILIVIVLFTIIRISSQATEIGLSRALGMKFNQIFLLLFYEPLLLLLISGIPGSLIGLLLLAFFASFFSPLFISAPPFILTLDVAAVIFAIASIVVVTTLSGIITSLMATRANISKILKVE